LLLVAGFSVFVRWRSQGLEPSRLPPPPEVAAAPAIERGELARGQLELRPAPAQAAAIDAASAAPASGSDKPSAALPPEPRPSALPASPARVTDVQTAGAAALTQRQAAERAATRVPAAQRSKPARPTVAPGPPKPFVFDFPDGNPYEQDTASEQRRVVPKVRAPGQASGTP